jgi:hypothetical protein
MIILESFDEFSIAGKSYKDIFNEEYLISKDQLLKDQKELIDFLASEKNKELSDFKRQILLKRLNLMYLILFYYEYLEEKYDMKIYRYVGKVMTLDMMDKAIKERASKMKSLVNNYGFDGGYINYWIFKDGIVFKTIRRNK